MIKCTSKKDLLIIGSLPNPVGGVTIHVERLLYHLKQNGIEYMFFDLRSKCLSLLFMNLFDCKKIHVHSSNVYVRFIIILFGFVFRKKVGFTLHGDLGRYKSNIKNQIDKLSIKLAYNPVLLNQTSYQKAINLNERSVCRSSFLPPNPETEIIDENLYNQIKLLSINYKFIFCTNAYDLRYDKNNHEIYGIFEIYEAFASIKEFSLIISDPSGAYQKELLKKYGLIPNNIIVVPYPHSFFRIIELSDILIRNTSTDGDSISIKEGLFLRKQVYCTNVVSRPSGVKLYERGHFHQIVNFLINNPPNADSESGCFKFSLDSILLQYK